MRHIDALTLQTAVSSAAYQRLATDADVVSGKAAASGKIISDTRTIPPTPLFFDKLVAVDKNKPELGVQGDGHFIVENLVLYYPLRAVGVNMQNFSSAGLTTVVLWLFAGLFPFCSLIFFSLATPASAPERAAAFYVKMKTPVAPTPELDHEEIERNRVPIPCTASTARSYFPARNGNSANGPDRTTSASSVAMASSLPSSAFSGWSCTSANQGRGSDQFNIRLQNELLTK